MDKGFDNAGDRLKEELTKSTEREKLEYKISFHLLYIIAPQ